MNYKLQRWIELNRVKLFHKNEIKENNIIEQLKFYGSCFVSTAVAVEDE